jgi:hypothetical protein
VNKDVLALGNYLTNLLFSSLLQTSSGRHLQSGTIDVMFSHSFSSAALLKVLHVRPSTAKVDLGNMYNIAESVSVLASTGCIFEGRNRLRRQEFFYRWRL